MTKESEQFFWCSECDIYTEDENYQIAQEWHEVEEPGPK